MERYVTILVYNEDATKILMYKRKEEPDNGKLDLPGCKFEDFQNPYLVGYEELKDKTGLEEEDIVLFNLINSYYVMEFREEQLFFGKMKRKKELKQNTDEFVWVDVNEDFYNLDKFAKKGAIWNMQKYSVYFKEQLCD